MFNLITVYTPVLLLAGSIVTSAKQILSPIHCEGEGKDGLSKDYVETYCYIEGTFNLYMKQAEQQVRPGHLPPRQEVSYTYNRCILSSPRPDLASALLA